MVEVEVKRLSNSEDRIPLMISERLIDVTQDYTGEYIMVHGQFRSYNRHEEQKNRLVLSVFVREICLYGRRTWTVTKTNQYLAGWLYLQGTDLPKDTAWKGNRRSFACG